MTQLISVRLPKHLLNELKKDAKKQYYLDLSEYVRSIIRSKAMEYLYPYKSEIAKMHKSVLIKQNSKKETAKKELFNEFKKFLEDMS